MTPAWAAERGRFGIAFAAGVAASLGFAPWNLWPLTLAGIALLLRLAEASPTHHARLAIGWWFGLGHFVVGTHWIAEAFRYQSNLPAWTGWLGVLLLSLYLAVYPAIATVAARLVARRGPALVLALAGAWVVAEWLRGWVFSGFPWNPLGAAALAVGGLAQAAALIGASGLSALVVIAAGGVHLLAVRRWRAGAALVAAAAAAAGAGLVPLRAPVAPTTTRLDIVQANIGQDEKWSEDGVERSIARYLALSPRASAAPRLLIWPEAAIPDLLDELPEVRARLGRALGPNDIMLLGALKAIRDADGRAIAARNSLFVLDTDGAILARYDKKRLVPFGEFLPARSLLEAFGLARLAPGALDFWPGPGPRTLGLDGHPAVGPLICYEVIFGGHVVEPGHRPRWLLNVSNDAWFAGAGAAMHLAQARLRSIEEGLPMARATPTGISAVIDARGRVLASIPRGRAAALTTPLPAALPAPPFARLGLLIPLTLAAGLIAAAAGLDRRAR